MSSLSVIVPIYNNEEYLEQCVDSLLAQTIRDFEVVLVDDGSTDGSGAICDRYSASDSRVRVIHKDNEGLCSARRDGMLACSGDFVGFVDSDDWVDPQMYETLFARLMVEDADIITSGFVRNEAGQRFSDAIEEGVYSGKAAEDIRGRIIYDCGQNTAGILLTVCTKIYRKSLMLPHISAVPADILLYEDMAYTFSPFMEAARIVVTHDIFYHYRVNDHSMSTSFKTDEYEKMKYSLGVSRGIYERYGADVVRSFDTSVCFFFYMYFYRLVNNVRGVFGSADEVRSKLEEISRDSAFLDMTESVVSSIPDHDERFTLELIISGDIGRAIAFLKKLEANRIRHDRLVIIARRVLGDRMIDGLKKILKR